MDRGRIFSARRINGTIWWLVTIFPQTGHMKVVIPPDIMDLDDSADLLTAKENSDLRLRCRATGTPKPMVTWRREDGRNITLRNDHGVKRGNRVRNIFPSGLIHRDTGYYVSFKRTSKFHSIVIFIFESNH